MRQRVYGRHRTVGVSSFAPSDVFSSASPIKHRPKPEGEGSDAAERDDDDDDDNPAEEHDRDGSEESDVGLISADEDAFQTPKRPARRTRPPRTRIPSAAGKDESSRDRAAQKATKARPKSRLNPLLKLCPSLLAQRGPMPFSAWTSRADFHFEICKIAEASFGEVYRLRVRRPANDAEAQTWTRSEESVVKVLALKFDDLEEDDQLATASSVPSVCAEVQLLKRMSAVPGFANFRDLRIVKGYPGDAFVSSWRSWDAAQRAAKKDPSEFPDPGEPGSYPDDQLWAIIEMEYAGFDLSSFRMVDVWSVWDVFWGVVLALAKGEQEAGFEHRDMHLGNICVGLHNDEGLKLGPGGSTSQQTGRRKGKIARGDDDYLSYVREANALLSALAGPPISITRGKKFRFTPLRPTLIDYTIARAELKDESIDGGPRPAATRESGEDEKVAIAYVDLEEDPDLFAGDASVDYQYEMYRCMRSAALLDDPLAKWPKGKKARTATTTTTTPATEEGEQEEEPTRTWRGFHPQTNVVWLHFVLHELMNAALELPPPPPKEPSEPAAGGASQEGDSSGEEQQVRPRPRRAAAARAEAAISSSAAAAPGREESSSGGGDGEWADAARTLLESVRGRIRLDGVEEEAAVGTEPDELSGRWAAAVLEHAARLQAVLQTVRERLDLGRWSRQVRASRRRRRKDDADGGAGGSGAGEIRSAADLVLLALRSGWLDENDVLAAE